MGGVEAVLIEHADGASYLRFGQCDGCRLTNPGQCCTHVVLPLARALSDDEQRWVRLHPGVQIVGQSVRIDIACSALEGEECSLFGSPDRPEMCGRYPELPEHVLSGCAYTFEKVS